jgi:hypothetical protein
MPQAGTANEQRHCLFQQGAKETGQDARLGMQRSQGKTTLENDTDRTESYCCDR